MPEIGKTIVALSNFENMGRSIAERNNVTFADVEFNRFPDKWPQLKLPNWKDQIEHKDVSVILDASNPAYTFANYALVRGILDYYAEKVRLIMPFFPVGTMERIVNHGDIATATYFADVMSHLPPGRGKKTSIHIFDIHAESSRFLFDSFKVNAEIHTAMRLIKDKINKQTTIVFPDDGAEKRYAREFEGYNLAVFKKKRKGDDREMELLYGDEFINGADVLIVDDMIQSGGTIRKSAKNLRERGAKKVDSYTPHGIFPDSSHKEVAEDVDTLYVSDTIPENIVRAAKTRNMKIVSIEPSVEKIIMAD